MQNKEKRLGPLTENKLIETIPESGQILDLIDKDFKSPGLKTLKELKETRRTIHEQFTLKNTHSNY